MDIQLAVTELKNGLTGFQLISGSADVPNANHKLIATPSAFAIPLAESAAANTLITTAISQEISVRFGVVLAVRNVADVAGAASISELAQHRTAVKAVLLGWQPASNFEQVTYVGGQLIKLDDDGVLWWLDTFETSYTERVIF